MQSSVQHQADLLLCGCEEVSGVHSQVPSFPGRRKKLPSPSTSHLWVGWDEVGWGETLKPPGFLLPGDGPRSVHPPLTVSEHVLPMYSPQPIRKQKTSISLHLGTRRDWRVITLFLVIALNLEELKTIDTRAQRYLGTDLSLLQQLIAYLQLKNNLRALFPQGSCQIKKGWKGPVPG